MTLPRKPDDKQHYHWHHIVPRHEGGTDEPDNLVLLTPLEHAMTHLKRFEETGNTKDLASAKILMGSLGDDGWPISQKGIKRPEFNGNTYGFKSGDTPWNKGLTYTHQVRPTKERCERISAALTGRALSAEHRETMRKQRNGNYRWMTNGEVDKRILKTSIDDYLKDGWTFGRNTGVPTPGTPFKKKRA